MPKQIWLKFTEILGSDKEAKEPQNPLHVATAALMIHVSVTHDDISDAEKQGILSSIQEHFDLEETRAHSVFEKALERHEEAVDLYTFTRVVMSELEHAQQKEIVRLLYRIAFADNHLEHFEEHVITRISSLLGIGPKDRVKIKQDVRAETKSAQYMTKRKTALLFLIVALGVSGAVLATNDASVKIKMKYGAECKIDRTCDTMFYVDCGAAVDGPAYYLDKDLEIIGTSGGLCMQGCTGAPKEWAMCDGRQSDGPNPDLLKQIDQ